MNNENVFTINLKENLNLWTIYYLLYGVDADEKEEVMCERFHTRPRIFIKSGNCRLSSQKFLQNHLAVDYVHPQGKTSAFSDVMKLQDLHSDKASLRTDYISKWEDGDVEALYKCNEEILKKYKPVYFREMIAFLLPNDTDDKNEKFLKFVPIEFKKVFEKKNKEVVPFVKEEEVLLDTLASMNCDLPNNSNVNAKILTWLLLLAFLRFDVIKINGFYTFKDEYSKKTIEKVKVPNNQFSVTSNNDKIDSSGKDETSLRTTKELLKCGWTPKTLSKALVFNDQLLYNIPENDPSEGNADLWESFIGARPETFSYLVNSEGHIIGNYSFCGLDLTDATRLDAGELFEGELTVKTTKTLVKSGVYTLLLLNLSCNVGESTTKNNRTLIDGLLSQIVTYAKEGVYFENVYTTVFLEAQESLYEEIGFEFKTYNVDKGQTKRGRVYKLDNFPNSLDWSGEVYDALIEAYKKKPVIKKKL